MTTDAHLRGALRAPAATEDCVRVALNEAEATSVASIALSLPDPDALGPRTLVLVAGTIAAPPSIARSVLAILGRTRKIPSANRCSALVARGFVDVGASADGDVVWGYSPS
jgi:hypothetical protein